MRPEPIPSGSARPMSLADALKVEAAERDRDGAFPDAAFAVLKACGLVARPPLGANEIAQLLALLVEIGRGDLSTGRIFEGHVNALDLIRRHAAPGQIAEVGEEAARGEVFGVWNTDDPGDPLRLEGDRLIGRKAFASGVDGLHRAIVTVPGDAGRRMILVPLQGRPVDRSWWRPLGMRSSGSHIVDFTGLRIEPDWCFGRPDDYVRQPWFSAGAARFAAVQVGGMQGVLDAALDHLVRTGRDGAPHQSHRIARMAIAVEAGHGWLRRVAEEWITADGTADPDARNCGAADRLVATVDGARSAIEDAALSLMDEAERSVGAAGLIAPHPLERRLRDLRTYLRQPNPDGARSAFAEAVASGLWHPGSGPVVDA